MVVSHRTPEAVDRLVLDLDAPTGAAAQPAPTAGSRRATAWLLVGVAALGLAFGLTHGSSRTKHDTPEHLAVVGETASPGPTVSIDGFAFTLPSGLVVHRQGRVHTDRRSRIDYVDALGRRSGIDVTVMRGPVAGRRATTPLPSPMRVTYSHIGRYPATVDRYGVGFSGPSQMEVRVTVSPHTLIWVETENLPSDDVVAMLTGALG
jgi:hypothetical protein